MFHFDFFSNLKSINYNIFNETNLPLLPVSKTFDKYFRDETGETMNTKYDCIFGIILLCGFRRGVMFSKLNSLREKLACSNSSCRNHMHQKYLFTTYHRKWIHNIEGWYKWCCNLWSLALILEIDVCLYCLS